MNQTSVIAIGLPRAGKTTFIAALGYILQYNEIPTALQLDRLSEDMRYLKPLIDDWLSCKALAPTEAAMHKLSFHLKKQSRPVGEIIFPDISGETFERHWAIREWATDFAELAKSAEGLLLFIHPNHVQKPYSIADVAKIARVAEADDNTAQSEDGSTSAHTNEQLGEPWDRNKAAPQVKLVDFLQMIERNTEQKLPLRLGVIISAWDEVLGRSKLAQPGSWFNTAMPLLSQFLTTNPETFQTRIYGVSAQGGDIEKDSSKLKELCDPSKRVIVIGESCPEHDLTEPLRWVLAADE